MNNLRADHIRAHFRAVTPVTPTCSVPPATKHTAPPVKNSFAKKVKSYANQAVRSTSQFTGNIGNTTEV